MSQNDDRSLPPQGQSFPEGATQRASDRTENPGGPEHTELDDRQAAGTPGGGTEVGGLAGTNFGEGDPDLEELHEAMGTGTEPEAEDEASYSGRSGGAVGGTPAGKRSSGGTTRSGIPPGKTDRGDSTIGSEPENE